VALTAFRARVGASRPVGLTGPTALRQPERRAYARAVPASDGQLPFAEGHDMCAAPRVGLVVPNRWTHRGPTIAELHAFYGRADSWDIDSLWVTDRLIHPTVSMLSPLLLLSYAAALTDRVRLGTIVLVLSVRPTLEVARQAATVDYLSGGRLSLGVSIGGRGPEVEQMRAAPGGPREFEESLDLLRVYWGQPTVGKRPDELPPVQPVHPRPVQPGGIPILIGAGSRKEAGVRRAGRLADGWLMGTPGPTVEDFTRGWDLVRESAVAAGRDPAMLRNGKLIYARVCGATPSARTAARAEIDREIDAYYGPLKLNHAIVAGTVQEIADEVLAYGEAGCEQVVLFCPGGDTGRLEQLAEVATVVKDAARA
jgi:alkanesulfonate monooxygenase SsuD/methylene tetrahydromethanopterin reductase-like flavin-dependent oxidoreductase (luciferase family)